MISLINPAKQAPRCKPWPKTLAQLLLRSCSDLGYSSHRLINHLVINPEMSPQIERCSHSLQSTSLLQRRFVSPMRTHHHRYRSRLEKAERIPSLSRSSSDQTQTDQAQPIAHPKHLPAHDPQRADRNDDRVRTNPAAAKIPACLIPPPISFRFRRDNSIVLAITNKHRPHRTP